jgi:PAS domain S-box-containing protein
MERLAGAFTDEARFRLLVSSVVDFAIYMLDPKGVVTSWNSGAQRFKGYTEQEIVGRNFANFYTPEDRAAGVPQRALATAEHEGKFEAEGWRMRKNGTRFWAHVVIDPIRAPDGTLLGFAKVTRDLTERRAAQVELERAREALAQSQKMEAVGQLTGGIAHDFNNLLTAVLGSLELVRKRVPPDEKVLKLIDNAMEGARRGATLTQRMLAFARRQQLEPELVEVPRLVESMTDLLDRSLGPAISINTYFPSLLPPVLVDANQLEMALLNLAVNARDAMPRGGPIMIAADEQRLREGQDAGTGLPPGRYIKLSVSDQGHGMDAATLSRAREPFFTTKGVGKGTGLGLSMVHGLAEQSGGRLILDSVLDRGTTASLWLPVAEQTARAAAGEDAAAPSRTPALSVLAVDDDALVLFNTAAMLEDLGHRVTVAYSAKEALQAMEGVRFDLLIVDHAMPNMTGAELIERVKKQDPAQPILLATGYAELPPGAAADAPRLAKPFLQSALQRAIALAMDGR